MYSRYQAKTWQSFVTFLKILEDRSIFVGLNPQELKNLKEFMCNFKSSLETLVEEITR